MQRQVVLAIAITGLLFLCNRCSAVVLSIASQEDETPPIGSARNEVEAQLGKPLTVTPLPDGGQAATYEYRLPSPGAQDAAEFAVKMWVVPMCGPGGCAPVGPLLEPFVLPYAVYKLATAPEEKVTLTYAPDGRLLHLDLPPPYGPDEDALGLPTIGTIRERCRSLGHVEQSERWISDREREVVDQYGYVECVSRGFAIWGIE